MRALHDVFNDFFLRFFPFLHDLHSGEILHKPKNGNIQSMPGHR